MPGRHVDLFIPPGKLWDVQVSLWPHSSSQRKLGSQFSFGAFKGSEIPAFAGMTGGFASIAT